MSLTQIQSQDIGLNVVLDIDLADASVGTDELKNNAVTSDKLYPDLIIGDTLSNILNIKSTIKSVLTTDDTLIIQKIASQTGRLLLVKDNVGTELIRILDTGNFYIKNDLTIEGSSILGTGVNQLVIQSTGNLVWGSDTNLYRSASSILKTDDQLQVALGLDVLGGDLTLGSAYKIVIGVDTNLYRLGANSLKTDDDLTVNNLITTGNVDGRDVSVDGGNLDNIISEVNAQETGLDDTQTPGTTATSLKNRLDQFVNRVKNIIGIGTSWLDTLPSTLQGLWNKFNDSTGHDHSASGNNSKQLSSTGLASGSVTRSKLNELRPHQQTVPDNTAYVESGVVIKSDGSGVITFAGGSSPVFPVILVNPRIDLLCLKDDATLFIQQGVEAVSPVPSTYPSDKRVITEVTITELANVIILDSDIKDVRGFGGGGGAGGAGITPRRYEFKSPAGGETVINLPFSYTQGDDSLMVFRGDGLLQKITDDYAETSTTSITLTSALVNGEVLQALVVPGGGTTRAVVSFTSQTSVTFDHNLANYPIIAVLDNSYNVIISNTIVHNTVNQVTVTFLSSQSGIIIAISGSAGRNDVVNKYKSAIALNVTDVVYKNTVADQVDKADSDGISTMPAVGLCLSQVSGSGQNVDVLKVGLVSNPAWAWTPGDKIYVSGTAGGLTNVAPTGASKVVMQIGVAKNATTIDFNFGFYFVVLS